MSDIICPICFDSETDMLTLDCEHIFCCNCIKKYIQTQVDDNVSEIYCPYEFCYEMVSTDKIKSILDDQDYTTKYKQACDILLIKKSGLSSFCPKCNTVCKRDQILSYKVYCYNCQDEFCSICKERHDYAYDYCPNKYDIDATLREIQYAFEDHQNIKNCPICNIIIYKEEGCSSVRCKYCKTKFCWECMQTSYVVGKLKEHECADYRAFHTTDSDGDYNSGTEYLSDSDHSASE